jgi:hypothetical protein
LIQGAYPAAEFAAKIEHEAGTRVEGVAQGSSKRTREAGRSKDLDLKKCERDDANRAPWRKAEMFGGGVGISIEWLPGPGFFICP